MKAMAVALLVAGLLAGAVGCTDEAGMSAGAGGVPKMAIRVDCGSDKDYVDEAGTKWMADRVMKEGLDWGATGGNTVARTGLTIAGTKAPELYLTERYTMDGYEFTLPNGKYTVRLHFAETFTNVKAAGQRVFTVKINGQPMLEDLDVFQEAGGAAKPLVKEIKGVAVTDGKLKIGFVAKTQNPEINGIEILGY